jgi:hypothetical protein
MLCSFERSPNVVRLHGRGRVVSLYDPSWSEWSSLFPENPAARAVVVVDVTRVSTSCGFALPILEQVEERDLLTENMRRRGAAGMRTYRRTKNAVSIDGLPAYDDDPDPEPAEAERQEEALDLGLAAQRIDDEEAEPREGG